MTEDKKYAIDKCKYSTNGKDISIVSWVSKADRNNDERFMTSEELYQLFEKINKGIFDGVLEKPIICFPANNKTPIVVDKICIGDLSKYRISLSDGFITKNPYTDIKRFKEFIYASFMGALLIYIDSFIAENKTNIIGRLKGIDSNLEKENLKYKKKFTSDIYINENGPVLCNQFHLKVCKGKYFEEHTEYGKNEMTPEDIARKERYHFAPQDDFMYFLDNPNMKLLEIMENSKGRYIDEYINKSVEGENSNE